MKTSPPNLSTTTDHQHNNLKYRSDIDCPRAVAVLCVVPLQAFSEN